MVCSCKNLGDSIPRSGVNRTKLPKRSNRSQRVFVWGLARPRHQRPRQEKDASATGGATITRAFRAFLAPDLREQSSYSSSRACSSNSRLCRVGKVLVRSRLQCATLSMFRLASAGISRASKLRLGSGWKQGSPRPGRCIASPPLLTVVQCLRVRSELLSQSF